MATEEQVLDALAPRRERCPRRFGTRKTLVRCDKREGHPGDHRGYRVQWNQAGERVKITEPTVY